MAVELSDVMYSMQAVNHLNPSNVQLATCMYKTKNLMNSQKSSSPLESLKDRQLKLMEKIDGYLSKFSSSNTSAVVCPQVKKPSQPTKFNDIVIHADPSDPPLSLNFVKTCLDKQYKVLWKCLKHSSIKSDISTHGLLWADSATADRSAYDLVVTVIWMKVASVRLMLSPSMCVPIEGEANLLRYFGRLMALYDHPDVDLNRTTAIDHHLNLFSNPQISGSGDSSRLPDFGAVMRSASKWTCGEVSIADALAVSVMSKRSGFSDGRVHKWLTSIGMLRQ